ncbi:MAG: hypothetical protein Q9168_005428 [Polycauliona sp. 1 TL-2023]
MAPSQTQPVRLPSKRLPEAQKLTESSNGGRPKYSLKRDSRSAKNIPWLEIFKHHISLVEGHLKMIEMVRKHTTEGSGDHRTICDMIDNTKQVLNESKVVSSIIVPPSDHIEREAAERLSNHAAEPKGNGEETKTGGLDHELGESKAPPSVKSGQTRAKEVVENGGGPASDPTTAGSASTEKKVRFSDVSQDAAKPESQMFFMDSAPTPVRLPTTLNASRKRKGSSPDPEPAPEGVGAQPVKKAKRNHADHATRSEDNKEETKPTYDNEPQINGKSEQAPKDVQIEYEDISAEVNKRMKEKEEKRKHKEQPMEKKKRKRDSEGSTAGAVESAATKEVGKPKKKKSKSRTSEDAAGYDEVVSTETNIGAADEAVVEKCHAQILQSMEKPRKKKRARSSQDTPTSTKDPPVSAEAGEGPAEKKKKVKTFKGASTSAELSAKGKGEKRPAEIAEAGNVEGEGKKKKQKKRKST